MKLNKNDPRLTAYAFGELPEKEAREIEIVLAESVEAQQAIAETRALGAALARGLAGEPVPDGQAINAAIQARLNAAEGAQSAPCLDPDLVVRSGAFAEGSAEAERGAPWSTHPAGRAVSERGWVPRGVLGLRRWRLAWPAWLGLAAAASVLFFVSGWLWIEQPWRAGTLLARREASDVQAPPRPAAAAPSLTEARPITTNAASESAPIVEPVPAAARPLAEPLATRTTEQLQEVQLSPAPEVRDAADALSRSPAPPPELITRYGLGPVHVEPQAGNLSSALGEPQPTPAGVVLQEEFAGTLASADAAPEGQTTVMSRELTVRYGLALMPSQGEGLVRLEREHRRSPPALGDIPWVSPLFKSSSTRESANPGYVDVGENPFQPASTEPLSTFSLDVDTGSYANVRRFLNSGARPPREAVRLEEMINYFPYNYAPPRADEVFGVQIEVSGCPWEPRHRLVRIAIKARDAGGKRPPSNFVFLVDVSGSMEPSERLPLLKQALKALVKRMTSTDRVALVTYASSAGLRLESTSCEQKEKILETIDSLEAGGSTNGEGGIRQAYEVATQHFIPAGVNRVLLCTDGDFNVGLSNQDELVRLIEGKARSGVFLTTLGVGTENFKDALMRRLADRGNGTYHYLDSFEEAQRVLIEQMDATFVTVARDAKAQVEFNPAKVGAWRLLGYEKRLMAPQEFNDDTRDAGEIGAGQAVTMLYEIAAPDVEVRGRVDGLKYQRPVDPAPPPQRLVSSDELLTLKLRYQRPEGSKSTLMEIPVVDEGRSPGACSADFRFAAAVASFGMLLRDSTHRGNTTFDSVFELAQQGLGNDPGGWRAEFLTLVRKAQRLSARPQGAPFPTPSSSGFE